MHFLQGHPARETSFREFHVTSQRIIDADLVGKAQQGDENAFAALFNANKTKVYSLCLRMTSNVSEAEDLTQETFLTAFRKLGTFRGDSALSTWLHRVAVNTVLMHFRKRGQRLVSVPLSDDQDISTPKRDPGEDDTQLVGTVDRVHELSGPHARRRSRGSGIQSLPRYSELTV